MSRHCSCMGKVQKNTASQHIGRCTKHSTCSAWSVRERLFFVLKGMQSSAMQPKQAQEAKLAIFPQVHSCSTGYGMCAVVYGCNVRSCLIFWGYPPKNRTDKSQFLYVRKL